jgi:hypothetical protein
MKTLSKAELERLAMEVAEAVTGPGSVSKVATEVGVDTMDKPAYHFKYLFHEDRSKLRPGRAMIRLSLGILDRLEDMEDDHDVGVLLTDETHWDGRAWYV